MNNKKIKVLQVNKLYAPWIGGVEKVAQDIAEGLNDTVDMRLLVCQQKGKASEDVYNGVPVSRSASCGMLYSMPISFDFFFKLRKMSKNADIVQFHSPFPLADFAYLFSGYKGKVAVWWHADIVSQRRILTLIKPIIKAFLKRADVIIAATQAHIDGSDFLRPHTAKCRVIPFGLKFADYERVNIAHFLSDRLFDKKNKKLLFVGRLVYYKGIDVLMRAMKDVNGAELFLCGTGVLEYELKGVAAQNGVKQKIHFLGYTPFEELKAAYADCDVFVFPSTGRTEAFGLAQMEAMFYGKPVVNTSLPTGVPLVSLDGATGITVPPGDAAALSAAIQRLVDDDDLRVRFGAAAGERCRAEYDYDKMMERVLSLYKELVGS